VFGTDTDRSVRQYQISRGLRVDGKVGPATWSELGY
jgi:peptidoglycan hydrolase-like protein with peptidoglycan-binding domain